MRKEISITSEESANVERLFMSHSAYLSMLQFLSDNNVSSNTEIYDRKWNEAVDLWIKLDKAKTDIEKKYKPAGDWDRYEFDFEKQQVIFVKDE